MRVGDLDLADLVGVTTVGLIADRTSADLVGVVDALAGLGGVRLSGEGSARALVAPVARAVGASLLADGVR